MQIANLILTSNKTQRQPQSMTGHLFNLLNLLLQRASQWNYFISNFNYVTTPGCKSRSLSFFGLVYLSRFTLFHQILHAPRQ